MKHLYLIFTFLCIAYGYGQTTPVKGEIDEFKLYPNPVTEGKVYITTMDNAPKQIAIYDVLGTQVLETRISGTELLLTELDAGIYVLRVYQNHKMATRKLVVK
ncbi:MAG TPA: T9SS type A sorting domain-containing protein [Pricia sp.]|nr:T9SS type A sorting domain-containing protein [Pricia sp.]